MSAVEELETFAAERRAMRLTDSFRQGVSRNPDTSVEAQGLAKSLDLPIDTTERNLDQARRQRALDSLDAPTLIRDTPHTAEFLSDPDNAAVAHDDVKTLTSLEKAVIGLNTMSVGLPGLVAGMAVADPERAKYLGRKFVAGARFGVPAGATGLIAAYDETNKGEMGLQRKMAEDYLDQFRRKHFTSPPPLTAAQRKFTVNRLLATGDFKVAPTPGSIAEKALKEHEAILADQVDYVGDEDRFDPLTRMVGTGLESVGSMGVGMLASIAMGNPSPMLAVGGAITYGHSNATARIQGLEPGGSRRFARTDAAIEILTELLPGAKLFKDIKAGTSLPKTVANNLIREGIGENVATFTQDWNAWGALPENATKTGADFLKERPQAALETTVAAIVGSGVQSSVAGSIGALQERVRQSKIEQSSMDEILNTVKGSKLRERDPERFNQFMQGPVGDHTVYVDQTLVQQLVDDGLTVSPEIARQLDGSGGDIAVTMRDALRDPEVAAQLRGHIRMSPDGLTTEELKDDGKSLIQEMLARAQIQTVEQTERSLIGEQVRTQLNESGRYNGTDAAKAAPIIQAYADRVASEHGISPMEVFKRMGLTIRGPNTPADPTDTPTTTLDQDVATAGADEVNLEDARREWEVNGTDSPYFKKWFGESKVADESGAPMVVYHGTPDARGVLSGEATFKSLKERYGKKDDSRAFFFTSSQSVARTYADGRRAFDFQNAENAVGKLYLSIKNPMMIDAKGESWGERGGPAGQSKQIEEARAAGHDGLIIRNTLDTYNVTGNDRSDVYVAFNSEQAKSAETRPVKVLHNGEDLPGSGPNRGTFDTNNLSILNQSIDAAGIKLTEEVTVAETGETVTVEHDAQRLHDQTAKRLSVLRKLERCLGA